MSSKDLRTKRETLRHDSAQSTRKTNTYTSPPNTPLTVANSAIEKVSTGKISTGAAARATGNGDACDFGASFFPPPRFDAIQLATDQIKMDALNTSPRKSHSYEELQKRVNPSTSGLQPSSYLSRIDTCTVPVSTYDIEVTLNRDQRANHPL